MSVNIIFLSILFFYFIGFAYLHADSEITLPSPSQNPIKILLEDLIQKRRTVRDFKKYSLTLEEISKILFSMQGITNKKKKLRAVPSAGGLYPLEIYLILGDAEKISPGVYKYNPSHHSLVNILEKDVRKEVAKAALGQNWMTKSSMIILFAAVIQRTEKKYGSKARTYVDIEVGHAAQNAFLETVALNLDAGVVGAMNEKQLKNLLNLPNNETPIYLMPIGKSA